jgi:hypothetical protein
VSSTKFLRWLGVAVVSTRIATAQASPSPLIERASPDESRELTPSSVLKRYDQINALLSTPVPQPYRSPYFHSNERLVERFYPRLKEVGGVFIGIGSQQNFSFLVHGHSALCVIFDINPDVTEILVPFLGQMMAEAPTRKAFLSRLMVVDLNEADVKHLLEPRRQPSQSIADLGRQLTAVVVELLGRVPREERRRRFQERMERTLSRLSLNQQRRAEVAKWFDYLEQEMLEGGIFFQQSAQAAWIAGEDVRLRNDLAGWLSTEENYQMTRRYWLQGRIIGVTGDIGGPSVAKLAAWLRDWPVAEKSVPVTFIYLANVGISVTGHETPSTFQNCTTRLDNYVSLLKP